MFIYLVTSGFALPTHLSLVVVHGGPSYSAIYLTFVKHSHSDVNTVIAIVSSYVMESLNAV